MEWFPSRNSWIREVTTGILINMKLTTWNDRQGRVEKENKTLGRERCENIDRGTKITHTHTNTLLVMSMGALLIFQ